MTHSYLHRQRGAVSGLLVTVITLGVLLLGVGSFAIWAFVSYNEAESDVQGRVDVAVAKAREAKAEEMEEKFAEKEQQPNLTFSAPSEYCGLRFNYPKTWSVHESEEIANGGTYKAYLNPKVIPPISPTRQFALRVTIEQKDYDAVLAQYQNLVQKGDLKRSDQSSQGNSGSRLTGNFSRNIRGDAVLFRCRDKTITIRTDADTFKNNFEAIIRTIDFNA